MLKYLYTLLYLLAIIPSYAQTDTAGAQFTFLTPRAYDYGGILLNANSEYKFQFKNSGSQPLVIKEMHGIARGLNTPPYKVIINYPQSPIRPGQKGVITVTVVAQGNTGSFKSEILVTSNATTANYPLLLITGAIVPDHGESAKKEKEPIIPLEFLTPVIRANTK